MYIPKRKWQVYKKLLNSNLFLNEKQETEYRLGEDKWMKDVYRLACLMNKDSYEIAYKYSTTEFEGCYILADIRGDVDFVGDSYFLFDRRRGYGRYNSQWKNFETPFNIKMKNSKLYNEVMVYEKNQLESLGISKSGITMDDLFNGREEDEAW